MNTSLRKSLTGIALSCMLLGSTVSALKSTGKPYHHAKAAGHALLACWGAAGVGLGCYIGWENDDDYGLENIINGDWSDIDNWTTIGLASLLVVPGAYTTYKNIRKFIALYKLGHSSHHKKSEETT